MVLLLNSVTMAVFSSLVDCLSLHRDCITHTRHPNTGALRSLGVLAHFCRLALRHFPAYAVRIG